MKESLWFLKRNKELLGAVSALRDHALEENSPWAVSLRMLEEEIKDSLERQIAKLQEYERQLGEAKGDWEKERKKLAHDQELQRKTLEERVQQLQARVGEMEKLRETENYRVKKSLTFKEAELERLRRMAGLDEGTRKRRRLLRAAAAALALLAAGAGLWLKLRERVFWRERVHELPYARPSALAAAGGRLLVADWLTQCLYFHGTGTGLPVERVTLAPRYHFSGLAAGGATLLASDKWSKSLWSLELKGAELVEIRATPSPGPHPAGLFLETDAFWSADPEARKLFRHRNDGAREEVKEYAVGALRPLGVLRRGGTLWVLDEATGRVYRNRPGPDLERPEAWVPVTRGFPPDGPKPVGLAADEGSLWLLTTEPARLYQYNLRYLGEPK